MLHCNRNIFFLKPMWVNLRKKVKTHLRLIFYFMHINTYITN